MKNILAAIKNRRYWMAYELATFRFLQPFGLYPNRINESYLQDGFKELACLGIQYLPPLDSDQIENIKDRLFEEKIISMPLIDIIDDMKRANETVRDFNIPSKLIFDFFSKHEIITLKNCLDYPGKFKVACNLRVTVHNQQQTGADVNKFAQQYHRDFDHPSFIKAFCYLNPVGIGGGQHEYLEKSHKLFGRSIEGKNRIALEEITRELGQLVVNQQVGEAGTRFFANTIGYHRGTRITNQDGHRIFAMFTFSKGFTEWSNEEEITI